MASISIKFKMGGNMSEAFFLSVVSVICQQDFFATDTRLSDFS